MDTLIRNATIITQDGERRILRGDILVQGNRIAEVSQKIGEKPESVIDASGMLAIPGLANMHTHLAMTLFRGYGEGLPLQRWLEEKIWPVEAKETPADAYVAAKLGIAEMLRSGTTAFNEQCLLGAKEIGKAAEETGMRGMVSQGLFDLLPGRTLDSELRTMERCAYPAGRLVSYGVGPHSVYTCSEELLAKAAEFAERKKLKIHTHMSETRKEVFDLQKKTGKRPFEYADGLGLVGPDSVFAHAGWVTKKEIALAGKKGLTIAHSPTSNLKLATGAICPIVEFDKAGANVCLTTDSVASNNCLSMFGEMKLAALLQKHLYWKADAISAGRVLDFATINGAKALGINAGRIEKGALADIVLLKPGANMTPGNDHISNIVYAGGPQNVTDVMVDGKWLMSGGRLLTIDEPALLDEAEALAKEIEKR